MIGFIRATDKAAVYGDDGDVNRNEKTHGLECASNEVGYASTEKGFTKLNGCE